MSTPEVGKIIRNDQHLSMKLRLKRALQSRPGLWAVYWGGKQQIRRLLLLRYFFYDVRHTYRAMHWEINNSNRNTLAAELLFQYHKIEKGLVMPGPRRLFGVEPAIASMTLCRRWISAGFALQDPVFLGGVETIAAYGVRLSADELDINGVVLPKVLAFLNEIPQRSTELTTPRPLPRIQGSATDHLLSSFTALAIARRSVREYCPDPVAIEILTRAVQAAQQAPSACNRQPCKLLVISSDKQKNALLSHQNGNRGFGHLAPQVAILTADENCFFDASERHEPYVDGGLFAMGFILSLREQGVGSCCLNWCVSPTTDESVHRLFDIPQSQRIIMLIAIGYPTTDCLVPRSPRRAIGEILQIL